MSRKSKKRPRKQPRKSLPLHFSIADVPETRGTAAADEPVQAAIYRPFVMDEQDERVRAIFGLPAEAPLPEVTEENLRRYHRYLTTHLKLPFQAKPAIETEVFQDREEPVLVLSLLDPDPKALDHGILCAVGCRNEFYQMPLVDVEAPAKHPNHRLIDDYASWFLQGKSALDAAQELPNFTWSLLPIPIAFLATVGAFCGAIVGATVMALDGAVVAVRTGALLLGLVACLLAAMPQKGRDKWFSGFMGALIGATAGGFLGAVCIAFVGSLTGALAGGLIGYALWRLSSRIILVPLGVLLGAGVGTVVQGMSADAEAAWTGVWQGGVVGAVGGPIVFFGALAGVVAAGKNPQVISFKFQSVCGLPPGSLWLAEPAELILVEPHDDSFNRLGVCLPGKRPVSTREDHCQRHTALTYFRCHVKIALDHVIDS